MKKNLVYLLCAVALFTSCSSAYKTSQTPDDVYYSPAQKINVADKYETYNSSADDEYLRMKVKDHEMWSSIDDYDYWYDSRYYTNNYYSPYSSGLSLSLGFNTYPSHYSYSPYLYNPWNSWYSPCYTVVYYKNPVVYYKPANRNNVLAYNNRSYNNYNLPLQNGSGSNAYSNSNSNVNRRNSNVNQTQNNDARPSRMFNNSSNSSSSMSSGSRAGGGGGGGGTRTRP